MKFSTYKTIQPDEKSLIKTAKKLDKKVRQAFCLTLKNPCYHLTTIR